MTRLSLYCCLLKPLYSCSLFMLMPCHAGCSASQPCLYDDIGSLPQPCSLLPCFKYTFFLPPCCACLSLPWPTKLAVAMVYHLCFGGSYLPQPHTCWQLSVACCLVASQFSHPLGWRRSTMCSLNAVDLVFPHPCYMYIHVPLQDGQRRSTGNQKANRAQYE